MATTQFGNGVNTNWQSFVNPLKDMVYVKSNVRFDKK